MATIDSHNLKGADLREPAVSNSDLVPTSTPNMCDSGELHELLRDCHMYLGDRSGLIEVPLPLGQITSELMRMELPQAQGSSALDLAALFDACSNEVAASDPDSIGALVFARQDLKDGDWGQLALSAAGLTSEPESRRVFTGDTTPTGIKSLRSWASDQLNLRGVVCPDLLLVVSELVTNVERYAPGWVMVDLVFGKDSLVVAVTDRGMNSLPHFETRSVDDVAGRGLWIVAAVSCGWGVVRAANSKTVWSQLRCESEP